MTVLTATGSIAEAYQKQFECRVVSARFASDQELEQIFGEATAIIHNAASVHCADVRDAVASNFILTKRVLDIAYRVNPQIPFCYISSMSILQDENIYKPFDRMTPYAFSKYLGEMYCLRHPHQQTYCTRFSTIFYGDEKRDGLSKLVFNAVRYRKITIYNGGSADRDFIPLTLAVQYLDRLLAQKPAVRVLNIVSGRRTSFKHVADLLRSDMPDLEVEDLPNESKEPVLSSFTTKGVGSIGEITHNLEYFIMRYIRQLQNESAYL